MPLPEALTGLRLAASLGLGEGFGELENGLHELAAVEVCAEQASKSGAVELCLGGRGRLTDGEPSLDVGGDFKGFLPVGKVLLGPSVGFHAAAVGPRVGTDFATGLSLGLEAQVPVDIGIDGFTVDLAAKASGRVIQDRYPDRSAENHFQAFLGAQVGASLPVVRW